MVLYQGVLVWGSKQSLDSFIGLVVSVFFLWAIMKADF